WDVPDPSDVLEELLRMAEERAVHEVVAFDSRERLGERFARSACDQLRVRVELARRTLPDAPGPRRAGAHRRVGTREPSIVRGDQITPLVGRNGLEEGFPGVREDEAGALLVEPVDLLWPDEEDATKDQPSHPLGMRLRVGETERAAPRPPEHDPALNTEL